MTTKQLINFIVRKGFEEQPAKSTKYRKFFNPRNSGIYWVGKRANIRKGVSVSDSISVTDIYRKFIDGEKS